MRLFEKLLIYALLSVFLACGVKAHELHEGTGVLCDTQAQIEQFASLNAHLDAIATVNAGTNACALATVRYVYGREVSRTHSGPLAVQVVEILVVQVSIYGQWASIPPAVQFTLFDIAEEGA